VTSENFNSVAYAQETDVSMISLLTLTVPDNPEPVRVCDTPVEKFADLGEEVWGVTSRGNRYIFCPMNAIFPRDDKTGSVTAKLQIENVSRQIVEIARTTLKPITVLMEIILSNDKDTVEQSSDNLRLSDVTYDCFVVEGTLSMDYLGQEPFPSGRFTPSDFPGLF